MPDEAVWLMTEFRPWLARHLLPADPTLYRLYEVLQVYGPTIKALVLEDCGDGIMSAITFNATVEPEDTDDGPPGPNHARWEVPAPQVVAGSKGASALAQAVAPPRIGGAPQSLPARRVAALTLGEMTSIA